jgi:hypothetical protein
VEGIEYRTRMRARRGLAVVEWADRFAERMLGDDVLRVPQLWGEQRPEPRGEHDGRDVVAERERIRNSYVGRISGAPDVAGP